MVTTTTTNEQGTPMEQSSTEAFIQSITADIKREVLTRYRPADYLADDEIKIELEEALKKEVDFCRMVLDAYNRWSQEEDPVVLWDIDDNVGKSFATAGESPNQIVYTWRFRACLMPLIDHLQAQYPNIKNGILSDRPELEKQLNDPKLLEALSTWVDHQHLYTSRTITPSDEITKFFEERDEYPDTGQLQKLTIIRDLQQRGLNIKVVDDNQVAKTMEDDGVYTHYLMPDV